MDWIFENLQIVIAIGAGIAYMVNSIRQSRHAREEEAKPEHGEDYFGPDFDFGESPQASPAPSQRPLMPPPLQRERAKRTPSTVPPVIARGAGSKTATAPKFVPASENELHRQQAIFDKLAELRQESAASKSLLQERRPKLRRPKPALAEKVVNLHSVKNRLRNSKEARHGIIMREILDRPIGLR